MTRRYAEDTKVPVEQSRNEIERALIRYGAGHSQQLQGGEDAAATSGATIMNIAHIAKRAGQISLAIYLGTSFILLGLWFAFGQNVVLLP